MKVVPIPTPSGARPDDPWPKKWMVAARLPFLTGCILPVVVATAAVWRAEGHVPEPLHALLAVIGVAMIHVGVNLANDYWDHRSGADVGNRYVTPFSGGSRVIQEGLLSARAVLLGAVLCTALGAACGVVLWLRTPGHGVLATGLAGIAVGWSYTAPPVRLAHHGLGELGVFVGFGVLPVLGAEWVQRGALSMPVAWAGVPAGLLITAVLLANEFPDVEADARAGKRTLVVRLGTGRAAWLYELLVAGAYAAVAVGIAVEWMPGLGALVGLAAPLSWRACRHLRRHHAEPTALVPALAATIGQHAGFLVLLTGAYLGDLALRAA